ncbi:MAG: DUF4158 domain-containing protein [Anaerolineae bacterium]|nr:DUF4158 domain-containing protein [Anaerolineae bacterium]
MPRGFLNKADRDRLARFPASVTEADRIIYFSLTSEDIEFVENLNTDHHRLGCALLLCSLRYLGYFPSSVQELPPSLVDYVAGQIAVSASRLPEYLSRSQNRWDLLPTVRDYLGFRKMKAVDRKNVTSWLGERALENERPSRLLQQLCEHLYQKKLLRPAVTTLESMVIEARAQAWQRSYAILVAPLQPEQREMLFTLLSPIAEAGQAQISWLNRPALAANAKQILRTIEKLTVIRQWKVSEWNIAPLPNSRLKWLAQLGRYSSAQALERKEPVEARLSILAAFLLWRHETLLDELIDLFDECLVDIYRRSKRDLREYHLKQADSLGQIAYYFYSVADVLLDHGVEDEAVRPTIYQSIPQEEFEALLLAIEQRQFGRKRADLLDFVDKRYTYIRRFSPQMLATLDLQTRRADSLLDAIATLKDLNERQDPTRELQNVPLDFVSSRWRSRIVGGDGTVKRRGYELCVLSELRDRLRAGDVWLDGSRRYADIDSYLIPREQWPAQRDVFCEMVGLPSDGAAYIQAQADELQTALSEFDEKMLTLEQVRLENDKLILSPLQNSRAKMQKHGSVGKLATCCRRLYPGELLAEVDRWCNFTKGNDPRGWVDSAGRGTAALSVRHSSGRSQQY